MKPIALLSLFVIFFSSHAQPYQSVFGKDSTKWNVFSAIHDGALTWSFSIHRDTIFNGLKYKIANNFGLFIREDTTSGKIWIRDNKSEFLVCDMGLNSGDTFFSSSYAHSSDTFYVDTIFYQNNLKTILFRPFSPLFLSQFFDTLMFMEGVGPNSGLFYSVYSDFGIWSNLLLCAYKDSNQTYANTKYIGDCDMSWGGIVEKTTAKIQLSPNPASNLLYITCEGLQIAEITIMDIDGRKILSAPFTPSLDISTLTNGLYFLMLKDEEERIFMRKIIIQSP